MRILEGLKTRLNAFLKNRDEEMDVMKGIELFDFLSTSSDAQNVKIILRNDKGRPEAIMKDSVYALKKTIPIQFLFCRIFRVESYVENGEAIIRLYITSKGQ